MDYMNILCAQDGSILAMGWATFTPKSGEVTGTTKAKAIPTKLYTDWEYDSVGKDIRLRAAPVVREEDLVIEAKDALLTKLAREALGLPVDPKAEAKLSELSSKVKK